jgi:hypothetical protein
MSRRTTSQFDLFAPPGLPPEAAPLAGSEDGRADMVARIRAELSEEVARLAVLDHFPWRDFTASALAELRFEGLARWLPEEEATPLLAAHAGALDRLYALQAAST